MAETKTAVIAHQTRMAELCVSLLEAVKKRDGLAVSEPTQADVASWNVACRRVFSIALQVVEEAYDER